VIFKSFL